MLRKESANQDADGRPIVTRAEDRGGGQYEKAFELLRAWIEDNLELYKVEIRRLLWPIFVYSYLEMHKEFYQKDATAFFNRYMSEKLTPRLHDHAVLHLSHRNRALHLPRVLAANTLDLETVGSLLERAKMRKCQQAWSKVRLASIRALGPHLRLHHEN